MGRHPLFDAEIGDYVVTARKDKHTEDWYVGGITDGTERTVELSLDFLDGDREYEATLYRDGDKAGWNTYPTDYAIEKQSVTASRYPHNPYGRGRWLRLAT